MTLDEKNFLKDSIGLLNVDQQRGIIDIVSDSVDQKEGQVFEFELDQLSLKKCRELEVYVKNCLSKNQKKEKRKQADAARRKAAKQQKNMQN